jgi:hypothetical protein
MRKWGGPDKEQGLLSIPFPAFATVKGTPAKVRKVSQKVFPYFV